MDIKGVSESYNVFFKRRELSFFIDHVSLGSPQLYEVRKSLAGKYNVKEDTVYVIRLETATGTNRTYGRAEIYESSESAVKVVPKHIQARNTSSRRKKAEVK